MFPSDALLHTSRPHLLETSPQAHDESSALHPEDETHQANPLYDVITPHQSRPEIIAHVTDDVIHA